MVAGASHSHHPHPLPELPPSRRREGDVDHVVFQRRLQLGFNLGKHVPVCAVADHRLKALHERDPTHSDTVAAAALVLQCCWNVAACNLVGDAEPIRVALKSCVLPRDLVGIAFGEKPAAHASSSDTLNAGVCHVARVLRQPVPPGNAADADAAGTMSRLAALGSLVAQARTGNGPTAACAVFVPAVARSAEILARAIARLIPTQSSLWSQPCCGCRDAMSAAALLVDLVALFANATDGPSGADRQHPFGDAGDSLCRVERRILSPTEAVHPGATTAIASILLVTNIALVGTDDRFGHSLLLLASCVAQHHAVNRRAEAANGAPQGSSLPTVVAASAALFQSACRLVPLDLAAAAVSESVAIAESECGSPGEPIVFGQVLGSIFDGHSRGGDTVVDVAAKGVVAAFRAIDRKSGDAATAFHLLQQTTEAELRTLCGSRIDATLVAEPLLARFEPSSVTSPTSDAAAHPGRSTSPGTAEAPGADGARWSDATGRWLHGVAKRVGEAAQHVGPHGDAASDTDSTASSAVSAAARDAGAANSPSPGRNDGEAVVVAATGTQPALSLADETRAKLVHLLGPAHAALTEAFARKRLARVRAAGGGLSAAKPHQASEEPTGPSSPAEASGAEPASGSSPTPAKPANGDSAQSPAPSPPAPARLSSPALASASANPSGGKRGFKSGLDAAQRDERTGREVVRAQWSAYKVTVPTGTPFCDPSSSTVTVRAAHTLCHSAALLLAHQQATATAYRDWAHTALQRTRKLYWMHFLSIHQHGQRQLEVQLPEQQSRAQLFVMGYTQQAELMISTMHGRGALLSNQHRCRMAIREWAVADVDVIRCSERQERLRGALMLEEARARKRLFETFASPVEGIEKRAAARGQMNDKYVAAARVISSFGWRMHSVLGSRLQLDMRCVVAVWQHSALADREASARAELRRDALQPFVIDAQALASEALRTREWTARLELLDHLVAAREDNGRDVIEESQAMAYSQIRLKGNASKRRSQAKDKAALAAAAQAAAEAQAEAAAAAAEDRDAFEASEKQARAVIHGAEEQHHAALQQAASTSHAATIEAERERLVHDCESPAVHSGEAEPRLSSVAVEMLLAEHDDGCDDLLEEEGAARRKLAVSLKTTTLRLLRATRNS